MGKGGGDVKFEIGDFVVDEDGTVGVVCIKYSDWDIVSYENDAAHPNPMPLAALWCKTHHNVHGSSKPK
jgi:hypothetical protein